MGRSWLSPTSPRSSPCLPTCPHASPHLPPLPQLAWGFYTACIPDTPQSNRTINEGNQFVTWPSAQQQRRHSEVKCFFRKNPSLGICIPLFPLSCSGQILLSIHLRRHSSGVGVWEVALGSFSAAPHELCSEAKARLGVPHLSSIRRGTKPFSPLR